MMAKKLMQCKRYWGMPSLIKEHKVYGNKLKRMTSAKRPSAKGLKRLWGRDGLRWDGKRTEYYEDALGAFA